MRHKLTIILVSLFLQSLAQFSPQAGLPGSNAIPANSPLFKAWVQNGWISPGYIDIGDTNFTIDQTNRAHFGEIQNIFGPADGKVVSLGDKGTVTIFLNPPIYDGPGYDFAVFENGFRSLNDSALAFLELAYVEVSSDGKNFFTFPAISLTQDTAQVGPFEMLDARKIYNLAGKYISGYGTPFDLSDLTGFKDNGLDLNNISFIRIRDVGGSINPMLASYDSHGHKINDPYPTPFLSSGFDLDAIGLINIKTTTVRVFPNPTDGQIFIQSKNKIKTLIINDLQGRTVFKKSMNVNFIKIDLSNLKSGLYFCIILGDNFRAVEEIILF